MTYNDGENHNLSAVLEERARAKGTSSAQIAQGADIPERYCAALFSGEHHKLPPPPYVRGYLWKIAVLLDLDGEALWQAYLKENPGMKTSGAQDKLPQNRFAIQRITRKSAVFILLAAFVILYGVYFADQTLRAPHISVASPASAITVTSASSIELRGSIGLGNKLVINGEEIPASRTGAFSKTISLSPGMNSVIFRVSRFLGGEKTVVRQIIYQP